MIETQTGQPMTQCPMASMCKGMVEKPHSRFILILPGILLILVGVIILLEPRILVWLVAVVAIILGILALMIANFIYRMNRSAGSVHS